MDSIIPFKNDFYSIISLDFDIPSPPAYSDAVIDVVDYNSVTIVNTTDCPVIAPFPGGITLYKNQKIEFTGREYENLKSKLAIRFVNPFTPVPNGVAIVIRKKYLLP